MKKKVIVLMLAAVILLASLAIPVRADNPSGENPAPTATTVSGVTYTYDAAGNRTARATGNVS